MKKLFGLVAMLVMVCATGAKAEGKRSFTGLYASLGQHQSDGDFTLSHQGPKFSFGEFLNVPLSGGITTYEVGYRLPLGNTKLRLGVNAVLHDGAIGGSKTWDSKYATAEFAVASDLRVSVGAELGAVLGKRDRLYVYVGAGAVATDLTAGLAIDTPWGDWADQKEGGALGATYRIGLEYLVNDRLSIGLSASQMKFDAGKAFGLGDMGEQRLNAELKQTTFGLNISYNF